MYLQALDIIFQAYTHISGSSYISGGSPFLLTNKKPDILAILKEVHLHYVYVVFSHTITPTNT